MRTQYDCYTVARVIHSLLWDEHNEAHINRQDVTPDEVDQVVFAQATLFFVDDGHRRGRLLAYGAADGRHSMSPSDRSQRGLGCAR